MMMYCSASLTGTTQVPAYEHVPYKNDRKAAIQVAEFTVQLKKEYKNEKPVSKEPSKIFVLSDIEGEYDYFKQLLLAAGVMDKKFNWTFGKGHFVICGDVFDRGSKVTECLWLIYFLEEKAKQADGYVHFILGNHELMNITGDLRYLNPKYLQIAQQLSVPYNNFYSKETELGRWLRSKNIMEKIGDRLFLHGGVSQYVNRLGQPVTAINSEARPYYDQANDSLMPPIAQLLLLDEGPLWYRGYFMAPLARQAQVDSTLQLFDVKKIILGHTPVSRISTFYNNKIINLDVPHAKGASEGLLIENKKYYRIALNGDKVLLLRD
jgi:hypothetical protein